MTLKAHALSVREDWDVISHDLESQRLLLDRLSLKVTLDKNALGEKVAILKFNLSKEERVVTVAGTT